MVRIDNPWAGAEVRTGVADVGELYGQLARRLEHIVRREVCAPDAVIEDACQIAWSRLLRHRDRVHPETVVGWLVRTAINEALRLLRPSRYELPFEEAEETALPWELPSELFECRERIAELGRLPARQQRAVWMQALGLNYAEIAVREDCTVRTVERQLLRARQRIREFEVAA